MVAKSLDDAEATLDPTIVKSIFVSALKGISVEMEEPTFIGVFKKLTGKN